jgi:hypothetical protein
LDLLGQPDTFLAAGIVVIAKIWWWVRTTPNLPKENFGLIYCSFIPFVAGLVMASIATACLNDTLVGADNCSDKHTALGAIGMLVGWPLSVFTVFLAMYLLLPQQRFNVMLFIVGVFGFTFQTIGGACIDDNLVGFDGCDRLWGIVLVTIGSGIIAFVLIIAIARELDKWEAHKGLIGAC